MHPNFNACAPEVVCVAVGANLLFPIAWRFTSALTRALSTDAARIVTKKFRRYKRHIRDSDVETIGLCAELIRQEQRDARRGQPRLYWILLDTLGVAAGVIALWTGAAKYVGAYSALFFLPIYLAVIVGTAQSLRWFLCLQMTVWSVKWIAHLRRIDASRKESYRRATEEQDKLIKDFGLSLGYLDCSQGYGKPPTSL